MAEGTDGRSTDPIPRIFLSSTSRDLAEHRQVVKRECESRGYALTVMEEFGAQDYDAKGVSVAEVEPCDVFVGVYARRYGYIPKGSNISVTEMEYDEAARLDKPRLLFVVAPDFVGHPLLEQHRDDQDPVTAQGLRRFLDRIGRQRVWDTFTTPAHLASRINFALSKWEGWRPPKPPVMARRFVGRAQLLADLAAALGTTRRAALGGIGGIGKSLIAQQFANQYAESFPAGTLWVTLGPAASDPEAVLSATMREWMRHHHPGRLADPSALAPATVRAWLEAAPQPLLVVLDDVWDVAPAQEVLRLVPSTATVIVTSRRGDVVRRLGIELFIEIDRLPSDEALLMLRDRVGDMPSRTALRELASVLDGHPLALEIAAAQIQREGPDHAEQLVEDLRRAMSSTATADADVPMAVDATLSLTYQVMGEDLRRRYRALGVLAPEAPIAPYLMAAIWAVQPDVPEALDDAIDRMHALSSNGVLSRVPGQPLFLEHGLVRAHARRLLVKAGELADADHRYARSVVLLAEQTFSGPSQTWHAIQSYLPHITFVGNATVDRFEEHFGAMNAMAAPAAAGVSIPKDRVQEQNQLLLRGLNFAAAVSTYLRERPHEGESAAKWLRMGVVAASALDEPRWTAKLLLDLGTWSIRHGNPGAAVEHFEQATAISRAAASATDEADAIHRLSEAYIETGRYDEAETLLEDLARSPAIAEDGPKRAGTWIARGILRRRRGDSSGALALYSEALPLLGEDMGQTATVLNNIGLIYREQGDTKQALSYLERALDVHRRLGNRREEATTLGNIAGVAWDTWDLGGAMSLYEKSLEAAREVGDRRQEVQALANLGTVYQRMGDAERGLALFEEALPIHRELGDLAGEAADLNNIGVARLERDPRTALSMFEDALKLNVRLGDRRGQAKVLNVIGDAWYALRDADRALSSYRNSLDLCRETGDKSTEAQVLQNLGILYHALKDLGGAKQLYEASLELMRVIGNRNGEAVNLSNLASVAFTSGDVALAKSQLHEALAIMREIGDRRSEEAILRNLEELEQASSQSMHGDATSSQAPVPDPASASDARETLIAFLNAEGPMRAIHYARHKAVLQSAEVETMLRRLVDSSRQSGNREMMEYGESVLAFLRQMRELG